MLFVNIVYIFWMFFLSLWNHNCILQFIIIFFILILFLLLLSLLRVLWQFLHLYYKHTYINFWTRESFSIMKMTVFFYSYLFWSYTYILLSSSSSMTIWVKIIIFNILKFIYLLSWKDELFYFLKNQ